MRKLICAVSAAAFICGFAVLAAEKTPMPRDAKQEYGKPETIKAAKMNAAGKVLAIADNAITVERSARNTTQSMTFVLDKQVKNISVGDFVLVAYVIKNDKLIAVRVTKTGNNISAKQPLAKPAH
ncbi:MAG TPA: hypothetical protein P5294_10405 [Smithellaceae bacterium]|nr:hypothetical protein [Smithellaceae bacterium]HRS90090.1 hypothetical protein [Smithellaceae bacterium]HRV26940.1 hypothetical protein [Smithellaceae bacterium]